MADCTVEDIGWRGTAQLHAGAEGLLDADWADPAYAPKGNEVVNCVIRRCGADSHVGEVFVAFSRDTRLAHNEIHDLPYSGISVGCARRNTTTSTT